MYTPVSEAAKRDDDGNYSKENIAVWMTSTWCLKDRISPAVGLSWITYRPAINTGVKEGIEAELQVSKRNGFKKQNITDPRIWAGIDFTIG